MAAIWIATAFALGMLARQVGLPPLVGFLAGGFALKAFGVEADVLLEEIAHIGVLLLLFTVGLKTKLKSVIRPEVAGSALLHLVVTGAALGVALVLMSDFNWRPAIILGVALGFSSTVFAAKSLESRRELRTFHGRVSIGILIMQDLVAVGLLSLCGGHYPSPWVIVLVVLIFARRWLGQLVNLTGHGELFLLLGLVMALAVGGLGFEHVGLSSELGALIVGALISNHPRARELAEAMWGLKEVFLVGFFLQIGMAGLPTLEALIVSVSLVAVLPLKLILFFVLLLAFKLRARTGFLAGLALASYSEFALIVAQLMVKNGELDSEWLVALSLAVALSFLFAAPLNRFAHPLYQRWEKLLCGWEREQRHPDDEPVTLGASELVVVGMGRIGAGAYDFFKERNQLVAGLDSDPVKVERNVRDGRRVVYADAEDPGFWERLSLHNVRAVLLTMPDVEAKTFAAQQLRRAGFRGLISATHVYPDQEQPLREAGCDSTFNPFLEAGADFAQHAERSLKPSRGPSE